MEPLAVVLFVALAGFVAWLSWHAKRRRREGLARMARQLGLEFAATDPFGLPGLPFALFSRGEGRDPENVMWGPGRGSR